MVSATETASTTVYVLFDEGLQNNEEGHHPTTGDFQVTRGGEEEYIDIEDVSYNSETMTVAILLSSPILPEDEPMVRVYSPEPTSIADQYGNITYRSDWMNIVRDDEKPVVTITGEEIINLYVGDTYTEQGATATDNYDKTVTVAISGEVSTSTIGTYLVAYDATDEAGNNAEQKTRTVNISARPISGGGGAVPLYYITHFAGLAGGAVEPTGTAGTSTATTTGLVLGESTFVFTINLRVGSRGVDVVELQKRLRAEGFFTYPTDTGYFGPVTKAAVIAYQKAHGIVPASGFVGPLTRAELNK